MEERRASAKATTSLSQHEADLTGRVKTKINVQLMMDSKGLE